MVNNCGQCCKPAATHAMGKAPPRAIAFLMIDSLDLSESVPCFIYHRCL
ncbi:MAG: hypothetical protein F6K28_57025 [Microcoleus sp. SIO2G3]|nr:hypothetical protein [Microcoleus sp. SIO2G3]